MANLDFLSIPIGEYIKNHLGFAKDMSGPVIFGVNYFLKDEDGTYLTGIQDKRVWLKWMELRVNGEIEAVRIPIGFLPEYGDLKKLFKEVLSKDYRKEDYLKCFSLRKEECLAKIERIENIYRDMESVPEIVFEILHAQRERLEGS